MEIIIPLGLDSSDFVDKLNKAESILDKSKLISGEKEKAKSGGIEQSINIVFDGEDRVSPTFKKIEDATEGLTDAQKEQYRQLRALVGAEQNSVVQLRNLIASKKQDIALSREGSEAYKIANGELREAQDQLRLQASLTNTNKGVLDLYISSLREQLGVLGLSKNARADLNNEIVNANQKLQLLNGTQKGSLAAKREDIRLLQEQADKLQTNSVENIRLRAQIQQLNKEVSTGSSVFKVFFNTLSKISTIQAGFTAINAAIQGFNSFINQFINQTKQLQAFELALRNVGLSQGEVNETLATATATANRLGAPLQQVEKAYKRMVPALRAVGSTTDETDKFLEAITARSQTLGLSTEESGRFLEAFAQVLSKGKLQAEELNQQISELDGAFRTQLADAIGVSTQELEQLISSGQVTADVFVKAVSEMENGVAELSNRVSSNNLTVQQLQNLIKNLETKNLRNIAAALEPGIKAFLDIGKVFQEFVAFVLTTEFGKFLVDSFNGVLVGARNFVAGFLEVAKVVIQVLDPIFELFNAVNSLLKPFGGLIGLLVTIIAPFALLSTTLSAVKYSLQATSITLAFFNSTIVKSDRAAKAFSLSIRLFESGKWTKGIALMIEGLKSFVASLGGPVASALDAFKGKLTSVINPALEALKKNTFSTVSSIAELVSGIKSPKLDTKQVADAASNVASSVGTAGDKFEKFNRLTGRTAAASAAAAGGIAETGVAAAGAAKSLTLGSAVMGGLAAAAAGVGIVVTAGLVKSFTDAEAMEDRLNKATQELADKYNILGSTAKAQEGPFKGLKTLFGQIVESYKRAFGGEQRELEALARASQQYDAALGGINIALKQQGIDIRNLDSVRKASSTQIVAAGEIVKDRIRLSEESIKAAEEEIRKGEEEKTMSASKREELQRQIEVKQQDLDQSKKLAFAIEQRINKLQEEGNALSDSALSWDQYKEAREIRIANLNIKDLEQQLDLENELTDTIEQRYTNEARRAGQSLVIARERISLIEDEIRELARRANDSTKSEEERKEALKDLRKAQEDLAKSRLQAAETEKKFAESLLDTFEKVIQQSTRYSQIWQTIAQEIQAAQGKIADTAASSLSSLSSLVDAVYERQINAVGEDEEARRALIREQLRAQAIINELEYDLQKAKLIVANRVAEIESKIIQERLKGEAAIAAARGDVKGASLLLEQAKAQDEVIKARQKALDIDLKILDVQRRVKDEQLNQKAITAGIDPREIGTTITNFGDLKGITDGLLQDVRNITSELKDPDYIEKFKKSLTEQKSAINEAAKTVKNQVGAYTAIAGYSAKVANSWQKIQTSILASAGGLSQIASIVGSGVGARWTGGPVEGGQTYRVNDRGLGREAFVNQFGRVSMLPASQNINWTAPSSGTILPAYMVKAMKRNSDINNKINVNNSQAAPIVSVNAGRAASTDSGNLVKQMSSAMTGSATNQRIVNNVTIQSQKPVEDASRIMTEAAMIRLRRSRRF